MNVSNALEQQLDTCQYHESVIDKGDDPQQRSFLHNRCVMGPTWK